MMNTQSDNTRPTLTLDTINPQIMSIISDLVLEAVERDDEHALWLAEFNEAIKAVKGLTREQLSTLENAPWSVAMPYGFDMFLMGLKIGRDPETILTLPECGNQR
jgi:hypothetical protein